MYVIVLRLHNITHSYFKLVSKLTAYSICSAHNTFSAPPIRPSDYIIVRRVRRTLNYRSRLNYTFSHLAKVRPRRIKRAKLLSRFSSIYTSSLIALSHLRKLAPSAANSNLLANLGSSWPFHFRDTASRARHVSSIWKTSKGHPRSLELLPFDKQRINSYW